MKVIQVDALKEFKSRTNVSSSEIQLFVQNHRLYRPHMPISSLLNHISDQLKKKYPPRSRSQGRSQSETKRESLQQLGLYLNQENNKQIFTLFQLILDSERGTTYEALARKMNTDIITVSHYCCKLKKLRLIDWQHQKQGVRVLPRAVREPVYKKEKGKKVEESPIQYNPARIEVSYDLKESLQFNELTMTENIWVNISSEQSLNRGGLTNEQIKRKIMKHAQNKMVRRTVESMAAKYFKKNAQRQGRVFQFRYKNETAAIKQQMGKQREEPQQIETQIQNLDEDILKWLVRQFPQFKGDQFLLKLINHKFKDYFSILGVKQSKRQCTPLKLNRYIKVLNYLHREGGMRESELRALIVKDEEKLQNGVMHKRSLMGILQGLKNLNILFEEEGIYYPGWIDLQNRFKRQLPQRQPKQQKMENAPKKKLHVQKGNKSSKKSIKENKAYDYKMISQRKYKSQLFTGIFVINLQKALDRCSRKAFNRIMYVERKKNIPIYTPQLNVLNILEQQFQHEKHELNFDRKLQDFLHDLDAMVEEKGQEEDSIPDVENELIKFVRKTPYKNAGFLRIKYGKGWQNKFKQLEQREILKTNEEGFQLSQDKLLI